VHRPLSSSGQASMLPMRGNSPCALRGDLDQADLTELMNQLYLISSLFMAHDPISSGPAYLFAWPSLNHVEVSGDTEEINSN
jgi:hypothetical protein